MLQTPRLIKMVTHTFPENSTHMGKQNPSLLQEENCSLSYAYGIVIPLDTLKRN